MTYRSSMTAPGNQTFNLEAEKAVLGASLLEPESIDAAASVVSPEDFSRPNDSIFRRELEVFQAAGTLDAVLLIDALRRNDELETAGGAAYIADLTSGMPRGANVKAYAELVRAAANRRRAIEAIKAAVKDAATGNGDSGAVIERLVAELEKIERPKTAGFKPPEYWRSYDVGHISTWECEPLHWIVEGILAKGNLCWIAGESQVGKTLFMLFVCLQLLGRGALFGKFAVNPVNRVFYLCLEDPIRRFKGRLLDMMSAAIEAGRFVVYVAPGLSIADPLCFQYLETMIEEGGFDLVVVDTWQKATAGISSFDDEKLSIVIHRLAGLTRKLGSTVIVNDHFRKPEQRSKRKELDASNVKGTQSKIANSDVFILMDRDSNGRLRVKGSSKDADRPIGFLLEISPEGCHDRAKFEYVGELEELAATSRSKAKQTTERILEIMQLGVWISCGDLAAQTKFSPSTVRSHLEKLIQTEKVEEQGEKRWKLYRRIDETTELAISGDMTKPAESKTSIASNVLPFKEIAQEVGAEAALKEPLPTQEALSTDINSSPLGDVDRKTVDRNGDEI